MGKYNFAARRVHRAAQQLLDAGRPALSDSPWFEPVGTIPPPQILVRTQPVQHWSPPKSKRSKHASQKPSKQFKPLQIRYPEDGLRKEFFKDHPWELARPRVVLENDGKDAYKGDWSTIRPQGRQLSGESVVQRQIWLLQHSKGTLSPEEAYDQARQEFYDERMHEDIERQTALEEARSTGAYFGKSMMEVGMQLEDQQFENWKVWANKQLALRDMRKNSAYSGLPDAAETVDDPEAVEDAASKEQKQIA